MDEHPYTLMDEHPFTVMDEHSFTVLDEHPRSENIKVGTDKKE